MIDLKRENLIALGDVPLHVPPHRNGKRLHKSAAYRWAQRGVRGVRLEVILVGGRRYTSVEALQRFADTLSAAELCRSDRSRTPRARETQIARASRAMEAMLGPARKQQVQQGDADTANRSPDTKGEQ
jgi:hypothetical protein